MKKSIKHLGGWRVPSWTQCSIWRGEGPWQPHVVKNELRFTKYENVDREPHNVFVFRDGESLLVVSAEKVRAG